MDKLQNMTELQDADLLLIDGGSRGGGVLHTVTGVAQVAESIAGGTPIGVLAGCITIGYGIGEIIRG